MARVLWEEGERGTSKLTLEFPFRKLKSCGAELVILHEALTEVYPSSTVERAAFFSLWICPLIITK